jgi:putative ABC transport system substrate-binding protein
LKRRELIALLSGAAAGLPLVARAQQDRIRRIGVLSTQAENDPEVQAALTAFRQGLERLGWSGARNVHIDTRFARVNLGQLPALAKELVALQPDVILAHSTPAVAALQRESRTIPIVFVTVSDPVGGGFVTSLARPGGNITGLLQYEASIVGKWLGMLKEIAPTLTRAAFVGNPKIYTYDYYLRVAQAIAPSLAIELVPIAVEASADYERAIELFAQVPNGGLFVLPNPTNTLQRALIIALAARRRLPAVYPNRFYTADGGLMSYGVDQIDMFRQTATYVDRILRGAKPADLPVQAPTKYETSINLKTAKAMGLTVPPGMLVAADEVIE